MTLFPKQNLCVLFFLLDSLRNIVWTVSDQYFGEPLRSTMDNLRYILWSVSEKKPPRSTVDNLRYILWSIFEKYCGQSPKTTSFYEVGTCSKVCPQYFSKIDQSMYRRLSTVLLGGFFSETDQSMYRRLSIVLLRG